MLPTCLVGNADARSGTTGLSLVRAAHVSKRIPNARSITQTANAKIRRRRSGTDRDKRSANKSSDRVGRTATHRMTPDRALFSSVPCFQVFQLESWGPEIGARLLVPGFLLAVIHPITVDAGTAGFGK